MTRAGGSRHGAAWPIIALALLVLLSIGLLEYLDRPAARRGPLVAERHHGRERPRRESPIPRSDPHARPIEPPGEEDWVDTGDEPPRVAIVIDDVGFEEGPALDMARLGLPLTFAILPFQAHTRSLATRLHASGREVILHLPMEPQAYPERNPGEGAVSEGMRPAEIAETVRRALDEVPEAVGVNNHMGSRVTGDPVVMRAVLEVVRDRRLYFLDSRTTSETIAYDMARDMGIPAMERSVFLDDRREASYIEGQVRELLKKARERGTAVGIGHADRVTAAALRRCAGLLRSGEVRIVPASELAGLDRRGSD